MNDSKVRRIIVGVDVSPSSVAALRWAIAEAELTGDTVEAIIAWQHPVGVAGYGWAPMVMDDSIDMQAFAEKTLTEAIDQVVQPGFVRSRN
jgi:nucleotide-binding universal stress UspA family protein